MIGVNQMNVPADTDPQTPCLSMRPHKAAKALDISERLLWDWTKQGIVPHRRIGGVILYATDVLREWLRREMKQGRVDCGKESEESA